MSENKTHEIKITFDGLFAFVYNDKDRAMSVLMVDGRRPGISSAATGKKRLFVHIPSLQFDKDLLNENSSLNSEFILTMPDGSKQLIWTLDGDDLELLDGDNRPISQEGVTLSNDFLDFTPDMYKIYPNSGRDVDENCLKRTGDKLDDRLVGRIRFEGGVFSVDELSKNNDFKFEFPSGYSPSIASIITVTLKTSSNKLQILSRQQQDSFRINLDKAPIDQPLVIALKNTPPAEVEYATKLNPDFDFEMVYAIATPPVNTKAKNDLKEELVNLGDRSVPTRKDSSGNETGGHGSACSAARFNNSALA